MSLGAILVGAALLIICIPFVADPFLHKKKTTTRPDKKTASPSNPYTQTLTSLRDLDFDHHTGKVSEEDYARLRAELLVRAAKELETKNQREQELDSRIENALRARRKSVARVCSQCGNEQKTEAQFCGACGAPLEAVCPNCGRKIEPHNLFCTGCGQSLKGMTTPKTQTAP